MRGTMDELLNGLLPLTFLAGVALLINVATTRSSVIAGQILEMTAEECARQAERVARLMTRLRQFRRALIALYAAVAMISLSALCGVLLGTATDAGGAATTVLLTAAVAAVTFASFQLTLEAYGDFDIARRHVDEMSEDGEVGGGDETA